MSRLTDLLRLPRWLERTWEPTLVDPEQPVPGLPDPREAETVPLPLYGLLPHPER